MYSWSVIPLACSARENFLEIRVENPVGDRRRNEIVNRDRLKHVTVHYTYGLQVFSDS